MKDKKDNYKFLGKIIEGRINSVCSCLKSVDSDRLFKHLALIRPHVIASRQFPSKYNLGLEGGMRVGRVLSNAKMLK